MLTFAVSLPVATHHAEGGDVALIQAIASIPLGFGCILTVQPKPLSVHRESQSVQAGVNLLYLHLFHSIVLHLSYRFGMFFCIFILTYPPLVSNEK